MQPRIQFRTLAKKKKLKEYSHSHRTTNTHRHIDKTDNPHTHILPYDTVQFDSAFPRIVYILPSTQMVPTTNLTFANTIFTIKIQCTDSKEREKVQKVRQNVLCLM